MWLWVTLAIVAVFVMILIQQFEILELRDRLTVALEDIVYLKVTMPKKQVLTRGADGKFISKT